MITRNLTHRETRLHDLAEIVIEETGSASPITYIPFEVAYPGKHDVRSRCPETARLEALVGPIDWPDIRAIVRDIIASRRA